MAVPSKKHQCTIDTSMNRPNEQKVAKQISQSEFDTSPLVMLLEDMQPVTTVERSGFKKFIMNILPHIHLPSRRTLGRQVDILYEQHKAMLIDEFKQVRYISLTADLWSSHKRGFLGMTAHYIDQQNLQFVSNTLTCRRFKHSHTGQEIAAMMTTVMEEFQISSKMTACVTDNAANMAKAFTFLKPATSSSSSITIDDDDDNAEEHNDSESFEVMDLATVSVGQDLDEEVASLMNKPIRCANHTLNLVAAVDSLKARHDDKYKRQYDKAMAKVQALSNAVSRSVKHADAVEDIIGMTFINPTCTRWSSEFNAVNRIVTVGLDKVRECQRAIGLAVTTEADMAFLKGFVQVMKPISVAMELLQGEKDVYIGHVIPTIIGLQCKLSNMNTDVLLKPLVKTITDAIQTRFCDIMNDDQYHVATALIPQFKLNYLPEAERRAMKIKVHNAINMFTLQHERAVSSTSSHTLHPELSEQMAIDSAESAGDDDNVDLFAFVRNNHQRQQGADNSDSNVIYCELENYLSSTDTTTASLQQYPHLLQAFLKYNSPLPSSAAVERLFSCAGQILSPRRCKLSDQSFEKLVFLRYKLKRSLN